VDGQSIFDAALHGKFFADCVLPDVGKNSQEAGDSAICRALGRRKVANVSRWAEHTRPQHRLVFLGDNGEGDAEAAAEMLRTGLIQHAFIRRVGPSEARLFVGKEPSHIHCQNLFYHDNYQQAAEIAHEQGLISEAAKGRVVQAAQSPPEGEGRPHSVSHHIAHKMLFSNADAREYFAEADGSEGRSLAGRWVNRNKLVCDVVERVQGASERLRERPNWL